MRGKRARREADAKKAASDEVWIRVITRLVEAHGLEAVDGWRQCAVSGAALTPQASIVACELGRLYLRDAVIEYLTSSGQFSEESHCGDLSAVRVEFAHIERLKDVFRVQLTPSDAPSREACAGHDEEQLARHAGPWACPVDRAVTTNGQHAFVALRPCGHVMRERVAAELFAESSAAGHLVAAEERGALAPDERHGHGRQQRPARAGLVLFMS